MKNEHEFFKSEEETLSLLQSTVIQKIERLQQIGRIDITTELKKIEELAIIIKTTD